MVRASALTATHPLAPSMPSATQIHAAARPDCRVPVCRGRHPLSFMPHRPYQPRQAAPAQTPASAPAPAPHALTLTSRTHTHLTHSHSPHLPHPRRRCCPSCCPQILQPAAASRPCSLQRRGGVKRSAAAAWLDSVSRHAPHQLDWPRAFSANMLHQTDSTFLN
jgi:hypothetical protein